ncbi:carboxymuconolactone decarboxylase family protein [Brevibacterium litoralis]|uniref:carboxymuconolactone decarboxylase family protein n=1 Tax=Brevibacterium litoralis TaxID=3138935 RepID=UPI0032EF3894
MTAFPFLDKAAPELWKSLGGLAVRTSALAESAGLERSTVELVNTRISQLNGCAYCLDVHTRKAREAGVREQQLTQLTAWRDSPVFDEVDRCALEVAEVVTQLPEGESRTARLSAAGESLGEETLVALEWVSILMNAYNRISILSAHPVRVRAD